MNRIETARGGRFNMDYKPVKPYWPSFLPKRLERSSAGRTHIDVLPNCSQRATVLHELKFCGSLIIFHALLHGDRHLKEPVRLRVKSRQHAGDVVRTTGSIRHFNQCRARCFEIGLLGQHLLNLRVGHHA